jgi:hypothetical protein
LYAVASVKKPGFLQGGFDQHSQGKGVKPAQLMKISGTKYLKRVLEGFEKWIKSEMYAQAKKCFNQHSQGKSCKTCTSDGN